nr:reverse transcriptase [Tanacetum cinerariifolium]
MEDIRHALFLCDWVQDIWAAMELNNFTNQVVDISIEEMLGAIKESKNDKFELTLMAMWRIWCARNSKAHEKGDLEKNKVVDAWHFRLRLFKPRQKRSFGLFKWLKLRALQMLFWKKIPVILANAFKQDKVLYHIRALFLRIQRLCLLFDSFSWSFVQRERNKVAHEMARIALKDNADDLYDGCVPRSVEAFVQDDVNSLFG